MTLSIGSIACLCTIPFAVINSVHHRVARFPSPARGRAHRINLTTALFFGALAFVGSGTAWGNHQWLALTRLLLPVIYYWLAYAIAGPTLHIFHPPEFSYDRPLIRIEERWFGNPSLWLARGRSMLTTEVMQFFYWTYFLYIPSLVLGLYLQADFPGLEAMVVAMSLGYAICYSLYPYFPLWGPRWALVEEGLLPQREQILPGYFFANFMNRICWSDTAHRGGAMPSAHSSTCVIFMIWCVRIWGTTGLAAGLFIGAFMFLSTVYGRYHYVVDLLVGSAIGVLALLLADAVVLGGAPPAPAAVRSVDSRTIEFPATVASAGFAAGSMGAYHLIVWAGGAAADHTLLRAGVNDAQIIDALEALGARPGDALDIATWDRREDPSAAAPAEVIEGPPVSIEIALADGTAIALADLLVDRGGRGFDMRFGGHRANIPAWHSGCIVCLYSCPGSKVGNARYTVRDFVNGATHFEVRPGLLPTDGTAVTVRFRLAEE